MNKEELIAKFNQYSDDELFEMVTSEVDQYSDLEVDVIIELLENRGHEIERVDGSEQSAMTIKSEEDYFDNLPLADSMNYLAEQHVKEEETRIEQEEQALKQQDDEKILATYVEMIQQIADHGSFLEKTDKLSFDRFLKVHFQISKRKLHVSADQREQERKVVRMMIRKLKKKARIKILIGFLLIIVGAIFAIISRTILGKLAILLLGFTYFFKGIGALYSAGKMERRR